MALFPSMRSLIKIQMLLIAATGTLCNHSIAARELKMNLPTFWSPSLVNLSYYELLHEPEARAHSRLISTVSSQYSMGY